ncbi:MAG: FGGY family carbohydrate kinase [Vicinamibacterales bacterium]
MPLYLGLDCSTQSLTAIVLDVDDADDAGGAGRADGAGGAGGAGGAAGRRAVVLERSLEFDRALPSYGTTHGVLTSADPRVVTAPPALWADALDHLLGAIAASGLDLSRLAAIAGSAQQHGSVYLDATAADVWRSLDPARPIGGQIADTFSRPVSPVWMDTSTTVECEEITQAMGGAARVAAITGSRAFERFTGPQIRRFWKTDPAGYARTDRIHLVSSFLASLLTGAHAPLDPGDASGMTLMDLTASRWSPDALAATAPDLARRLPAIVPAPTVVGTLAPYWRARHGLPAASVVAWSGDNPSSLVGLGLVRAGMLGLSLGTSDVVFGPLAEVRVDPAGTGHVFGAPIGGVMGLTVFRNGSLARERVRDACGLDWAGFSAALAASPPGNRGALMLPWFEPEITPHVPRGGARTRGLDETDRRDGRDGRDEPGVAARVRAVVEGQMASMATHAAWMGLDVRTIHATGGASANREILQVMADVFDADVLRFETTNAACLGAALRAFHAHARARGRAVDWPDVVQGVAEPVAASRVRPDPAGVRASLGMRREWQEFERAELRTRRG